MAKNIKAILSDINYKETKPGYWTKPLAMALSVVRERKDGQVDHCILFRGKDGNTYLWNRATYSPENQGDILYYEYELGTRAILRCPHWISPDDANYSACDDKYIVSKKLDYLSCIIEDELKEDSAKLYDELYAILSYNAELFWLEACPRRLVGGIAKHSF